MYPDMSNFDRFLPSKVWYLSCPRTNPTYVVILVMKNQCHSIMKSCNGNYHLKWPIRRFRWFYQSLHDYSWICCLMEMFYWNILKQAKRKFDNALWQIISLVLLSIIMVVLWKLFQSLKYFSLIFSIERYLTKLTFGFWIFFRNLKYAEAFKNTTIVLFLCACFSKTLWFVLILTNFLLNVYMNLLYAKLKLIQ